MLKKHVADNHDCVNPVNGDGGSTAYINKDTHSSKDVGSCGFNGCISLVFPTVYNDPNKWTLQIYLDEVVVTEITTGKLELDLNKLSLAIWLQ